MKKKSLTIKTGKTFQKELLGYQLQKIVDVSGGKILYGLYLAISVKGLLDDKDFIDMLWEEILDLPSGAAVKGIHLKEIKEWPLSDEYEMYDMPIRHKKVFEGIAPYIGNSDFRFYNVFITIVANDNMIAGHFLTKWSASLKKKK